MDEFPGTFVPRESGREWTEVGLAWGAAVEHEMATAHEGARSRGAVEGAELEVSGDWHEGALSDQDWSKAAGPEGAEASGRPAWPYLLVVLACLGILYVKAVGIDHKFFALTNETSVETWSLHLPMRYRLEYWRYKPTNPAGGVRILQDAKA